jgi:putative tricarboxylic transport membrane protein
MVKNRPPHFGDGSMRVVNIIVAIVLILFGCFYSYLTMHLPDRNLPNTLGSSFLPWVLAICLFVLSILLLLQSLIKVSAETCDYAISKKEGTGILFLVVLVVVYIKTMAFFGFLLVTPFFLVALMLTIGARKWKEVILTSTLVTFGIYLFFQKVFQIILPAGEFF